MDEPATLTIPNVFEVSFATSKALSESAVSPDWEINITKVFSSRVFAEYLNSDAKMTSVEIPARDSNRYFPVREA